MCSSLENDQLWEISHHPVMIICLEQQASMRFIPFVKACGLYSESQWEKVNPLCRTALQSYLKFNEHSDFSLSKEEEKKKKSRLALSLLYHLFTSLHLLYNWRQNKTRTGRMRVLTKMHRFSFRYHSWLRILAPTSLAVWCKTHTGCQERDRSRPRLMGRTQEDSLQVETSL